MKIYTKTGDKGTTSLFGGGRVPKDSLRIEVLGLVDELSSVIGICVAEIGDNKDLKFAYDKLEREQSNILRLGADIATPIDATDKFQAKVHRLNESDVKKLENEIDEWEESLKPLTQFILPGGSKVSAFVHHSRSICRRCELKVVALSREEQINPEVLKYLNRLSDWFFVMARYVNELQNIPDKS